MYNFELGQRVQTLEQTVRKLSDQLQTEPLELVLFDQLVQVDREQFERDAHVVPEREVVQHVDDVHRVVPVLAPQMLQDPNLLLCLVEEPHLIPDHLQRDVLARLVIEHFEHLAEASSADQLADLVPAKQHKHINNKPIRNL